MLFIEELRKNRRVYVVERNPNAPKIHKGKIENIVCFAGSHYLRVKTDTETIKVQISGKFLPGTLLNNSIFFDFFLANQVLQEYKDFLLKLYHTKGQRKILKLEFTGEKIS